MQLIAPSNWMAQQAARSLLARDWPIAVIPIPLDVRWWGAVARASARKSLGLSSESTIVLFGALGGDSNPGKGADLLYGALELLPVTKTVSGRSTPLEILTFGGKPGKRRIGHHVVRSVGRLDDEGLRLHYAAADVMVVPSRVETFGQTASEALACGTPVVAFRTSGLLDIVQDGVNGRLADPFSSASLARSISSVVASPERHLKLSDAARASSLKWEPARIAKRYGELFDEMLSRPPTEE